MKKLLEVCVDSLASRCCKFSIDKQQPIVLLLSSTR